jgi:CheY-like chemotaxis protein
VANRSQAERKHIFAINGAPEFLNIVCDLFQEEGYNVTTTNFVHTSFEQIATAQPDALIVDVVVGERAGWDLLEQLNASAATAGIPVLVLSTSPRLLAKAQEQAARYGTHRYLDKPFALDAPADPDPGDDWGGLTEHRSMARTMREPGVVPAAVLRTVLDARRSHCPR